HRQILVPCGARRQRLRRSQPGVLLPAGERLRGGRGIRLAGRVERSETHHCALSGDEKAMGFAALYPSYRTTAPNVLLRRNQRTAFAIPSPEPLAGQVSAAPPAINPVVPAKVLIASQHRLAEVSERQAGPL